MRKRLMIERYTTSPLTCLGCGVGAWMLAGSLALAQIGPPRQIHVETEAGSPIRGWAVVVELGPQIEVLVTEATEDAAEATPTTVDAWAETVDADVALNANFFGSNAEQPGMLDVIGLSVSDGEVVSPPRQFQGVFDYALAFDRTGRAAIARIGTDEIETGTVWDAVAGVGPSPNSSKGGTLLVTNGRNTAAEARVQPNVRHPRTAVGVDAAGERLFVVVIDGRRPGWSVGITLPELAELFLRLGADDAINLDGGGSSTLVYEDEAGRRIINKPSDGSPRPVANHLGIRLKESPAPEAAFSAMTADCAPAAPGALSGAPLFVLHTDLGAEEK
jgi:hypothetical protein